MKLVCDCDYSFTCEYHDTLFTLESLAEQLSRAKLPDVKKEKLTKIKEIVDQIGEWIE